ncbi:hypothetical protein V6N13_008112 [Hibiscus sabdariffa]
MVLQLEEHWVCSTLPRGIFAYGDFVEYNVLIDLPLCGKWFTWFGPENRCRQGPGDGRLESGDELSVLQRLRGLKAFLRGGNLSSFGDVDRGIHGVMKQIDELDNKCRDNMSSQEVVERKRLLQGELWKLSWYSESIWR